MDAFCVHSVMDTMRFGLFDCVGQFTAPFFAMAAMMFAFVRFAEC
jgi:hypothetical protein